MAFPSSTVEVLERGVQRLLLKMGLLKEHDLVSLPPDPILDFLAKEGDVAEGKVESLLASLGFLWEVFSDFHSSVRNKFISGSCDEPDLGDFLPLLQSEVRQRSGKGPIISQPVDVVNGQNGLVMPILV